jgi:hypothetical protein
LHKYNTAREIDNAAEAESSIEAVSCRRYVLLNLLYKVQLWMVRRHLLTGMVKGGEPSEESGAD